MSACRYFAGEGGCSNGWWLHLVGALGIFNFRGSGAVDVEVAGGNGWLHLVAVLIKFDMSDGRVPSITLDRANVIAKGGSTFRESWQASTLVVLASLMLK
jgi:hypothetical protein